MTTVKYFSSAQSILPALSGVAGALQNVLRTVLDTGAGAANVQSLTVSGGIATASYAADPGYIVDNIALFAGAAPAEVNGLARILSRPTANSLTFATAAADGTATGTITSALASAGWDETFVSGTTSVFKPTAVESLGMSLRVDDAGGANARVVGYETMSDVNTGTGPVPTAEQMSGGLYWPKSQIADSSARSWLAIADGRGIYLAIAPLAGGRHTLMYAGDVDSDKPGDAWAWVLTGNRSDQTSTAAAPDGCVGCGGRAVRLGAYIARSVGGVGGSTAIGRIGESQNGDSSGTVYSGSSAYSATGGGPNAANNALLLTPLELIDIGVRGRAPGLYHARQGLGDLYSTGSVVEGQGELAGRRLVAIRVSPPGNSAAGGVVFVDLTGPWSR